MSASPTPPWLDSAVAPADMGALDDVLAPVWDVVVVGAGIVGLCAAASLADSGRTVCILEAADVGGGTTSSTTVKVATSHGLVAAEIAARHGLDVAVEYQQANDRGFQWLSDLVESLPDDVEWVRVDHIVHALERVDELDAAYRVAAESTSNPREVTAPPWARGRAVTWGEAALVQPVSLARSLARQLHQLGTMVAQGTRVRAIRERRKHTELRLDGGATVRGTHVVIATGVPITDPEFLVPRMSFQWHLSAAVPTDEPVATTLGVDEAGLSTRPAIVEGRDSAIVVGPACTLQQIASGEAEATFRSLARSWFDLDNATHRWTARDSTAPGLVPIMARARRSPHVTIITGMNAWGFTNAAAIARELPRYLDILHASGVSASGPVDDLWNKGRSTSPLAVAGSGARTASAMARGLASTLGQDSAELPEGSGVIVGGPLSPRAVCRTRDGVLHTVSARCTHAGCVVEWNAISQNWSCPCHASQFAPDGSVIAGPATQRLAPIER